MKQQRIELAASEEYLADLEIRDAIDSSPEERIAAAVELLDSVYELWLKQGLNGDRGLCRFPGCTQERRRGLCRDPGGLPY